MHGRESPRHEGRVVLTAGLDDLDVGRRRLVPCSTHADTNISSRRTPFSTHSLSDTHPGADAKEQTREARPPLPRGAITITITITAIDATFDAADASPVIAPVAASVEATHAASIVATHAASIVATHAASIVATDPTSIVATDAASIVAIVATDATDATHATSIEATDADSSVTTDATTDATTKDTSGPTAPSAADAAASAAAIHPADCAAAHHAAANRSTALATADHAAARQPAANDAAELAGTNGTEGAHVWRALRRHRRRGHGAGRRWCVGTDGQPGQRPRARPVRHVRAAHERVVQDQDQPLRTAGRLGAHD